ncbi:hypothetical protein, partial [Thermococcus sp. GR7]|uniref:hypothetical protein n=1 Tax=Thermococcus sp. GR7 TaxID=1638257 RepID=UPI00142F97C6
VYMIIFVFSIIYPLILLVLGTFDKKWTYFALVLSIICFVLLIPYFIYVKDILKPPNLVKNLKREAFRNNANTPELILSLYRIAAIAYSEGDKKTVEASIEAFSDVIQNKNNQYRKEAIEYLEKLAEDCLSDRYIISKILKT